MANERAIIEESTIPRMRAITDESTTFRERANQRMSTMV